MFSPRKRAFDYRRIVEGMCFLSLEAEHRAFTSLYRSVE